MPAKKKSAAKASSASASTEDIHRELKKALADASSKLKNAKGANVDVKLKLVNHAKQLIDIIWPC